MLSSLVLFLLAASVWIIQLPQANDEWTDGLSGEEDMSFPAEEEGQLIVDLPQSLDHDSSCKSYNNLIEGLKLCTKTINDAEKEGGCETITSIAQVPLNKIATNNKGCSLLIPELMSTLMETYKQCIYAIDELQKHCKLRNGMNRVGSIKPSDAVTVILRRGITSCSQIKKAYPKSKTGYYLITLGRYKRVKLHCYMGKPLCNDSSHEWRKIAYHNVYEQGCPHGFLMHEKGGYKACGRTITNSNAVNCLARPPPFCQSIIFPVQGIEYTQICGQVIGYTDGNTGAFYNNHQDLPYVDGISITLGGLREHIWTYAAGYLEVPQTIYDRKFSCKCPNGALWFVGPNYYCESSGTMDKLEDIFRDQLWDGKNCHGTDIPCCNNNNNNSTGVNMPWFKRVLSNTASEYIEMRVCGRGDIDSGTLFSKYEFYVR